MLVYSLAQIENLKRSNNLWNQNALMIKKSIAIPVKFCTPEALLALRWTPGLANSPGAKAGDPGASTSGQQTANSPSAAQLLQKYDTQLAQSKAFVSKLDTAFPEVLMCVVFMLVVLLV